MESNIVVAPRFNDFLFDWDYETYLLLGGYGSGKSHHIAIKIVLRLLEQKRKALVTRAVFSTLKESCFDLIYEVLDNMGLIGDETNPNHKKTKVIARVSPLSFLFPNGSRIIFKGLDKTEKIKSLHGVSIIWAEECSELKYSSYKELLGRLRTKKLSMHFILSCNPVAKENWVYKHFFKDKDKNGKEIIKLDDYRLYKRKTIVNKGVYFHHSTPEDNPFLPPQYIRRLDDMKKYDEDLYRVARLGRFGAAGIKVLPQIKIATNATEFKNKISAISYKEHYFGFDFGFETSYNAVISMAVDTKKSILYIYDEIYKNKITDDKFAASKEMQKLKLKTKAMGKQIIADNEDPKAIKYYRQEGFQMRGCRNKFAGSRLSNTRKVKRFKQIVISPKCINTISELQDLTYKVAANGDVIFDEFNLDPHSFSAIWYALDEVTVADYKERTYNSKSGRHLNVM